MEAGQSEPRVRRGGLELHLGQWKEPFYQSEGRMGQEKKNKKYCPF
jgi:hypothetical protein